MRSKPNVWVVLTGLVVGAAAVLLTAFGNPANMGFCIACFLRDMAGSMGLHRAEAVQYLRPEIIGLVLGAFVMSLVSGEFRAESGSSPATRFIISVFVMIGALVFLGCPLRMVIRMGGGDLNAWVGLLGFGLGVWIGVFFLKRGFSLRRSYPAPVLEGVALPGLMAGLLVLLLAVPGILLFSESGPGSLHAPQLLALGLALAVGALAQRSRLCMVGGLRDVFLFGDFHLLYGFAAVLVAVFCGNLLLGNFSGFSTYLQPIAHASQLWNLLGMVLVGWGGVLLGGCPLRQLILAGSGNGDSAVSVLGMLVGAAVAHNWGLASSAAAVKDEVYAAGGPARPGQIAVIVGFVVLLAISYFNCKKPKKEV